MKMDKKTSYISIRVSPRDKVAYRRFASIAGISLGRLVRTAVEELMSKKQSENSMGGIADGKELF